jgi:hypothetical protein
MRKISIISLLPNLLVIILSLAACIAIYGLFSSLPSRYTQMIREAGSSISEEQMNASLGREMQKNSFARWSIGQGIWALQASSIFDLLQKMQQYTLEGIARQITCPTLICDAEEDHAFAGQPKILYDALKCPKTYLLFTAEDAAEEYCHTGATLLLNQRVFDWLEETLKHPAPATTNM